jgi:hypothetical protein
MDPTMMLFDVDLGRALKEAVLMGVPAALRRELLRLRLLTGVRPRDGWEEEDGVMERGWTKLERAVLT